MSTATDYLTTNAPLGLVGWGTNEFSLIGAGAGYTYADEVTLADANANGLTAATLFVTPITDRFGNDMAAGSGPVHVARSDFTVLGAGTVTQLLVVRNPAGSGEICGLIDGAGIAGFPGVDDSIPFTSADVIQFTWTTVWSGDGPSMVDPTTVVVGPPPVVRISATPSSGLAPLTVTFDGTSSTVASGPASYFWDFGGGDTSTSGTVTHTFSTPGAYPVTLTVADTLPVVASASITITVIDPAVVSGPPYPISVALYDETNTTKIRDLDTAIIGSRRWQDVLNDLGSAGLQVPLRVPNDDRSAMVTNPELLDLTRGRVLRFALDGVERFPAPIRPRKQTSIAEATKGQAPDKSQLREVTCQGLLSEWNQTIWFPGPGTFDFDGADTRHLGWMGPETDISGLASPTVTRNPFAETHPDPILDAFGAILDASVYRYWLIDFTPDHDMKIVTQGTAWDTFQWWLQGIPAGSGALPPASSKSSMYHYTASLKAGVTYRFGFDIQGLPSAPEVGFLAAAWEIVTPSEGNINVFNGTDNLFRTDLIYDWKCSVGPVGITAKQAIRTFLTEGQARRRLRDWSLYGDDDTIDANGGTLDLIADLPVQIGGKGGDFLLKMAASWCDLSIDVAGKTLRVYRWGERGDYHINPTVDEAPIYAGIEWGRAFADEHEWAPNLAALDHEERTS